MYKHVIFGAVLVSGFALAACDTAGGACIDTSGYCSDVLSEEDCTGIDAADFGALYIEGESCGSLPTGACATSSSCLSAVEQQCTVGTFHSGKSCDDVATNGACVDNGCEDTTNFNCSFGTFTEGKTCDEVDPMGACFDSFGSTSCDENKRKSECDDSTQVHCEGETCANCDENG